MNDKQTTLEHFIEIDGRRLHYFRIGNGPKAVIVMHGWGCSAETVRILAEAASDSSTTVYNIDLPGFGSSDEPPASWGIFDYTALIDSFCRQLGIERPVLMGHSFGGRIAIVMASRSHVDSVILVDAAGIKPRRKLKYYLKVYSFKAARRLLPIITGRRRAQKIIDRWRAKAGSSDYNNASPTMRAVMSRVVNEDLTDLLPLIKAPTLLIWGENDTATPLADAKTMKQLIPDAGLVAYPGAGHYSFLDRPAQTAAVIASFLNFK